MNQPLVSVIIATYRRTDALETALASLYNQSYRRLEIVLVDDNDDTVLNEFVKKTADRFISKYPEIPLLYKQNHPNMGAAEARNIGIRIANGEYVTFLDDDDIYLQDKLKNQLNEMQKNSADYSLTDLKLYNEKGAVIDRRIRKYIKRTDKESLLKYHMMYHLTGTDTLMFRKEYIEKIGAFPNVGVGDEFYMMLNAIKTGGKFCHLGMCDVKAVVHTGEEGMSSGQSKIEGENSLYEFKKTMFAQFGFFTVKYIKMRHYAVLAFAELRRKRIKSFVIYGLLSFFHSPVGSIKLLVARKI